MAKNFPRSDKEISKNESYPNILVIDSENFSLVRVRDYDQGAIYKKDGVYARVAPLEILEKEYETHNLFSGLHFPIPKLLGKGKVNEMAFYLEEDIGTKTFQDYFTSDINHFSSIQEKTFEEFKNIVSLFTHAQAESGQKPDVLGENFFKNVFF